MGKIEHLVIHCTATPEGREFSKERVQGWFRDRGWKHDGYHLLFHLDNRISSLQKLDLDDMITKFEVSNGVKGINSKTIHFSYIGGVDENGKAKDTRTAWQKYLMYASLWTFIGLYPEIKISGHNQWANKACPSFDVPDYLDRTHIPAVNINRQKRPSNLGPIISPFDFENHYE